MDKIIYRVTRERPSDRDEFFYSTLKEALSLYYRGIRCYNTMLLERITLEWRALYFEELMNEKDTLANTYDEFCTLGKFKHKYSDLENFQQLLKEIDERNLEYFFYDKLEWKIKTPQEYFYDLIDMTVFDISKKLEFSEEEIEEAVGSDYEWVPDYSDKIEYHRILLKFEDIK